MNHKPKITAPEPLKIHIHTTEDNFWNKENYTLVIKEPQNFDERKR